MILHTSITIACLTVVQDIDHLQTFPTSLNLGLEFLIFVHVFPFVSTPFSLTLLQLPLGLHLDLLPWDFSPESFLPFECIANSFPSSLSPYIPDLYLPSSLLLLFIADSIYINLSISFLSIKTWIRLAQTCDAFQVS